MGKNKNRSDLLAAGREKLQQFRQKNRGNSSKSSGKGGKTEQNTSADVGAEVAGTSLNIADGATSKDAFSFTESSSRVDSLSSDSTAARDELSEKDATAGTSSLEVTSQVLLEGPEVDATKLTENIGDVPNVDVRVAHEGEALSLHPENSEHNMPDSSDQSVLRENSADLSRSSSLETDVSSQMEKPRVEEQVSDVGAMQEVGSSSYFPTDKSDMMLHGADGDLSPNELNEPVSDHTPTHSGNAVEEDVVPVKGTEASMGLTEAERSSESNADESTDSIGSKHVNLSSGLDGSSIKLSKLADILRFLDEDEFRFLFLSREALHQKTRDIDQKNDHVIVDNAVFERVREQLYITSFLKDAFHLQISEGQKLIDETLASNALALETQGNNEVLSEENARYKLELQQVLSERDELQKQLSISKAEVEEFAAKVDDLQNKLETTQRDLSGLFTELVDTKNLVEALQAEDEYLNGSLKLMSEAKKMLLEENEKVILENENLAGELAMCKASLECLQKEMVDATDNLSLLKDDRRRLQEENDSVVSENVQEKAAELDQSEQRVSSLREKLSIAVTKGKSLISQRDSLKQSLAEASRELEKCSQELLNKDSRLNELESKLKIYSEAGERMEALESELSYIRNSATALRESFLLKDSVLQRIEEILEDLDLPEHFHSRDIIEKIDWLAKSVNGNSGSVDNWDQRSSLGGGSYSDPGFVGPEPNVNSDNDLRRRFEELENKFYGLAEQNEMLEQSLLERNNLVQRLEESLGRLDMPSQLRTMEPEDKIQWLESALSGAKNLCDSLQQKVDTLEDLYGIRNGDVEDAHRRISELEDDLRQSCAEKDVLSKNLEILSRNDDETSRIIVDLCIRAEYLRNEIVILQEQKIRLLEGVHHTDFVVEQLQDFVRDTLQDSGIEFVERQEGLECFEEMLRALIEKYKILSSEKPVGIDFPDAQVTEKDPFPHISSGFLEQDLATLSKKLEDSEDEIKRLKEEKDQLMISKQSLLNDVETLGTKKNELQELLHQEEQKSASLREKLNVAVRKGKSLVQQRDGMKQVIEELNAEVTRLKSETNNMEKVVSEYETRFKALSVTHEKVQALEYENARLNDRLAETEVHLKEKEGTWSIILSALNDIDVGLAIDSGNPIEKVNKIGHYLHDLRTAMDSAQQESIKSRRAATLLLEELNEVQERNDGLQEELAKAAHALLVLSQEKDIAENAKHEALSNVGKLSYLHSEEKGTILSELAALTSNVEQMKQELSTIIREVGNVLSSDLEVMRNVETVMKSYLELGAAADLIDPLHDGFNSRKSKNKAFNSEMSSLWDLLDNHSDLLHVEVSHLSEVMRSIFKQYTSKIDDSMKRDLEVLESFEKQKESELHGLRENVLLLCQTCTSIISEIKSSKDHEYGKILTSRNTQRNLISQISVEEDDSFARDIQIFTEDDIRGISDKLAFAVKDLLSSRSELVEVGQREMKITLLNLQKELQEKDVQRERISMELVNQVKEAENNAKHHLHDLQQARIQLQDLQEQVIVRDEECKLLEQKVKELQNHETNSRDLQEKVGSLTDELLAKEQGNEALMQALEEEEVQMEDLANKIRALENELQQKNRDLENLEASRAKALKKLSITVGKFDELHHFSESLLTEVEKLQSQLQERDGEVSFLRQEVTRCINDALAVTQMTKKRSSDEIHDFLSWLNSLLSPVKPLDAEADSKETDNGNEYKERIQKHILGLITELENLRLVAQNSDMLLQQEKSKVGELALKEEHLKNSLREKEYQLVMLQGVGDSGKPTTSSSEIVEVEPSTNKWASSGTMASQVRSLRKTNNDQVAIAIDVDHTDNRLEDDDDKVHFFSSWFQVPHYIKDCTTIYEASIRYS